MIRMLLAIASLLALMPITGVAAFWTLLQLWSFSNRFLNDTVRDSALIPATAIVLGWVGLSTLWAMSVRLFSTWQPPRSRPACWIGLASAASACLLVALTAARDLVGLVVMLSPLALVILFACVLWFGRERAGSASDSKSFQAPPDRGQV